MQRAIAKNIDNVGGFHVGGLKTVWNTVLVLDRQQSTASVSIDSARSATLGMVVPHLGAHLSQARLDVVVDVLHRPESVNE